MKTLIIGVVIGVLVLVFGYLFFISDILQFNNQDKSGVVVTPPQDININVNTDSSTTAATTTEPIDNTKTQLGTSVKGNPIMAYHYGTGEKEILFVGGIHAGYSWNTTLLAYELMDYLDANPETIPKNLKITVIPVINPDGLAAVVGTTGRFEASAVPKDQNETIIGRFNANNVDLNRNFDCQWQSSGSWQNKTVSGGTAAFSEPESMAIRDYVTDHKIAGAVVWYSAAGGVYASNCNNGVSVETKDLTALYAKASGYPGKAEFNFYDITGDMVNWFAKENIPAISVLLSTYSDTQWIKNKAGIDAVLEYYSKK